MPRPARLTAGLLSIALPLACDKPAPPPSQPATRPTPATAPATQPVATEQPPTDVLSVVRLDDPNYPTESPLETPADLPDAAKIILKRPAYVDSAGNLWLSHPAGQPLAQALCRVAVDHTVVTREDVTFVCRLPEDGPHSALVRNTLAVRPTTQPAPARPEFGSGPPDLQRQIGHVSTPADGDIPRFICDRVGELYQADFTKAVQIPNAMVVPFAYGSDVGVLLIKDNFDIQTIAVPRFENMQPSTTPAIAVSGDGVWVWCPWGTGLGSRAVFIEGNGAHLPDQASGWPGMPIEVIPLGDGSVQVISVGAVFNDYLLSISGKTGPFPLAMKIIGVQEKPATALQLRSVRSMAEKLADPDPLVREQTQRQLEAEGPSVFPILESLREQLPPEAQVRIETLLGQRFAPTLGGLRPLPGKVTTLARFPGGGCVLRFEGGATIDDEGTPRSVIPATVLIRPGRFIELFDPASFCDFVPGRNTIQWVGGELLIGDPKKGLLRVIGRTAKPLLPPAYADFDTVKAIDARRRWLLTSTKRPGETLLIDPSLPDTTPKLPTWTLAANVVGHTDDGYVALKRGDRLFVLARDGWRVEKPDKLRIDSLRLPALFDQDGNLFSTSETGIDMTDPSGGRVSIDLPGGEDATLAVANGRLLAYTTDGKVRRYAISRGPTLKPEATFTQGVPRDAKAVWLDPAGRLVMTTDTGVTVGFPDGRIPGRLKDLMMNVER